MSFTLSSEYVPASHLFAARKQRTPPLGLLLPIRDIRSKKLLDSRFPKPAYVPLTTFLTFTVVYSSSILAGLFHPAATSGIAFLGAFPGSQLIWLIARSCSLVVSYILLRSSYPVRARSRCLNFRALIQLPIRSHRQGFYACQHPIPS
jgi:hypothetical protein